MNKWYITGDKYIIDKISELPYFSKNMGRALTNINERTNERELTMGFTKWYYDTYSSLLFKRGSIGTLEFYIDYYLKDKSVVGFFKEGELQTHQYATNWDIDDIDKNGIDNWLSNNLEELDKTIESVGETFDNVPNKKGNPELMKTHPGQVKWDDIKEYYNQLKKGR